MPRGPARPAVQPALVVAFPTPGAIALRQPTFMLGRDELTAHGIADSEVSGRHLELTQSSTGLQVADVGSRNGTWIDGQPLARDERVTLADGAVIRVGRTILVYREALEGPLGPSPALGTMIGPFGLRRVAAWLESLRRLGPTSVLVRGETGTGKELVAALVAEALGRQQRYAPVNVAGVAAGVFESQLFGHVAGAFSDARQAAKGIVIAHQGGAVFLDEIGELAPTLQPKLLRLLENREVLPVGAERPTVVDVVIIAATNRDLEQMVVEGTFRRDLAARLAMAEIELPALRDRAEDIFPIARALAARIGLPLGHQDAGRSGQADGDEVEVEAVERLLLDPWPNNVRGLIAALQRVAAVDPAPGLHLWSVEQVMGRLPTSTRAGQLTPASVQAVLEACGGNESEASRRLGVSRGRLRRFLGRG